eukprot:COSAG01_NODE_2523_length_7514_cov_55.219420_3_plen_68_part_00
MRWSWVDRSAKTDPEMRQMMETVAQGGHGGAQERRRSDNIDTYRELSKKFSGVRVYCLLLTCCSART